MKGSKLTDADDVGYVNDHCALDYDKDDDDDDDDGSVFFLNVQNNYDNGDDD